MRSNASRATLFLAALCLMLGASGHTAQAACLRVPDHLRGYELRPGLWVFVCKGVGVDYVKRNRRLITWRTPNLAPSGLHPVRYLDVRRVLGHGVNWVSVAVDPTVRHGLQNPAAPDVIQPVTATSTRQSAVDPPDIPFSPEAGPDARDRLHCTGVWKVPEGNLVAAMTIQLYADGRHHARFAGVDLQEGTRDGRWLAFTKPGRIKVDGWAQFHPDGRGGWKMRCRFGVIEYDYYGKGRHRHSSFAGRRGELRRYH